MLVECLDGVTYHVLIGSTDVKMMDDQANLSSMSLGAFLYGLRNGLFKELK